MTDPLIRRLEYTGPTAAGLAKLELDPADFQSDLPDQHWYVYHEDADAGLTVGVWTTTPMQEAYGPYPGDEFMVVLEGTVTITDASGGQISIAPGQAFAIQDGALVSWKQDGFCRKFFVINAPPNRPPAKNLPMQDGVHVLGDQPGALETASGGLTFGTKQEASVSCPDRTADQNQMIHILSGEVHISEPGHPLRVFSAGDVFFIPQGAVFSWRSPTDVSWQYCQINTSD